MVEYIERTEELMLAMNAGARAIENTKHYHGSSYCKDPFSGNPKEISYLRAADVLREAAESPIAEMAPVRYARWERDEDGDWRCTGCRETVAICEAGRERTYRKPYCPNCGARMDGDPNGLR